MTNKSSIKEKKSISNSNILFGDIIINVWKNDGYCMLKIPGRKKQWRLDNFSDGREVARWITNNQDHIEALKHEDIVYSALVSLYGTKKHLIYNKVIKTEAKVYIKYDVAENHVKTGDSVYYDYEDKIIHLRPKPITI